MKPVATAVTNPERLLSGAQFADAFALILSGKNLDALSAAQGAFGQSPRWIKFLLHARNILVAPFGLKQGATKNSAGPGTIGIFPVLLQSANQIVMGLDDRHLDFRLFVDVSDIGAGQQSVTATTVVKTHNLLGRAYLTAILPFHRVIARTMLAQLSRA